MAYYEVPHGFKPQENKDFLRHLDKTAGKASNLSNHVKLKFLDMYGKDAMDIINECVDR